MEPGRPKRPSVDGNSATSAGILVALDQVCDAFDKAALPEIQTFLRTHLGPEIPAATIEPDGKYDFRGGAYLPGPVHRRCWRIDWSRVPFEASDGLDAAQLHELLDHESHFILQWTDHLPFLLCVIQAPAMEGWYLQISADAIFKKLPRRLGPTNRIPQSSAHRLLCIKTTEARMKTVRARMQSGVADAKLRIAVTASLEGGAHATGSVTLRSPCANVLLVEGSGSGYLGDENGPSGPIRAYIFSSGNQGPFPGADWHLPMWIPAGLGTTTWIDFNFLPFLQASIKNAQAAGVEAGPLDERLAQLSEALVPAIRSKCVARSRKLKTLHRDLLELQANVQHLRIRLRAGATRSPIHQMEGQWSDDLQASLPPAYQFGFPDLFTIESPALSKTKVREEGQSEQVLAVLETQVARTMEIIATEIAAMNNRRMMVWTISGVVFSAAAVVVALFIR